MKTLLAHLVRSIAATAILAIVCCGLYPLALYGVAQLVFPKQANGSLIVNNRGDVLGSELLGQKFTSAKYFHPRPSAAGVGYDAASSGGSNLGPTSRKLAESLKKRIQAYRTQNGLHESDPIPADAATASASGLDPHISLRNAELQAARVANSRHLNVDKVRRLLHQNVDRPSLRVLGDPGVNVLKLNLALDSIN